MLGKSHGSSGKIRKIRTANPQLRTERDFFKPWRRRFGVLTLGLACVLMAGWVRTFFFTDRVSSPFGKTTNISLWSFRSNLRLVTSPQASKLRWSSFPSSQDVTFGWNNEIRTAITFPGWGGGGIDEDPNDPTRECDLWSCPLNLLGCAVYLRSADKRTKGGMAIVIPYWSLVIPLTLLSAYLLFGKPRPANTRVTQSGQPSSV